ncbi:hypothetical protein [Amycolatopsis sacchari]|uniref:hypothetical protein n=1 Tax=Amycolatopsis sacchari TaxID=115433 RepID=UPI001FEA671C|nr:hypothetical protein [Amycolatopsis sacchari]
MTSAGAVAPRAAFAARSRIIASIGPGGPERSSQSVPVPAGTLGQPGSGGDGRWGTPSGVTRIRIAPPSENPAGTPASTAAPRTTDSRPARDSASWSK